jgi:hypothetical protein
MHRFIQRRSQTSPKRCTGCTNKAHLQSRGRQIGSPHAPFLAGMEAIQRKMVHHVHHSLWFSRCSHSKWCITNTILTGVRFMNAINGARSAPLLLIFPLRMPRMVHHMHHSSRFSRYRYCKWCTACTIPFGSRSPVVKNGVPHAPFLLILALNLLKMVQNMHHPSCLSLPCRKNGSCRAPSRAPRGGIAVQMAHHTHQKQCVSKLSLPDTLNG